MSNRKRTYRQERHIRIRSVRRDPPDLRKFASAIISLAQAQAEAEAEAETKLRVSKKIDKNHDRQPEAGEKL